MKTVLLTAGTEGDVRPFVQVGERLQQRGHSVVLATNEDYRYWADAAGIGFHPVMTREETAVLLDDPGLWHPVRSIAVGARWMDRTMAKSCRMLIELGRREPIRLAAYPPLFAGRVAAEVLRCPFLTLVSMPWMIPSIDSPPRMAGLPHLSGNRSRSLVRSYWAFLHGVADFVVGRRVNRLLREFGLGPVSKVTQWGYSTRATVGLFPEWYAPPQPDWPLNTRLAGFPKVRVAGRTALPDDVNAFLNAGEPPVAVTFGSGMKHGRQRYAAAAEACERLGLRAILLTKFGDQLPDALRSDMLHCPYAAFHELFPHCRAVIHHGGIGTTAKALEAGVPQVIAPMAWDQPDNASRVARLGAGVWHRGAMTGVSLARSVECVLNGSFREQCRMVAGWFERDSDDDPLDQACEWVEEAFE